MMRWLLIGMLALGAACGKDNNATPAPDSGADAAPQDLGHDVATPDMAPEPDTAPPADMHTADMGAPDAAPDMVDMTTFPDVMEQNCAHPASDPMCPGGLYGPGTLLDSIEIVPDATCCADVNGDGTIDNKIGGYLPLIATATGSDVNGNIAAAVQAGQLAYLFEYANWGNETFDADLDFRVFLGVDADLDYTDNLAGNGQFNILAESFDPNGDPKWSFDDVTVNNGRLVGTGGQIQLFFPYLLDEVQMLVTNVRVEADVVPPADLAAGGTVTLQNGELSGALDRNLFYDSMNEAANACACLQKSVLVYDAAANDYSCDVDVLDEQACAFDPSSGCRFLSNRQACQFLELVSGDLDVDADGDGTLDSFSVGVRFTGVGASIIGRQ